VIETVKGERQPITCPAYVSDAAINLSENSIKVLEKRYLRRDFDGSYLETPAGMFYRVAYHIAQVEREHGGDVEATTKVFYDLLSERRFFPNSPTFTGAGTPLGQLAACFVLPIEDDMGKDSDGIFSTLRVAALIQQTGGGNGFSFSRLRPKNDIVHTSSGRATGPVGFLRVYDQAFGEIAQGGSRRGANMGVLRVDHPDIEEFIGCKAEEGKIANFNISVAITDEFMVAVRDDTDFTLRNPRDGKAWKTVHARDLFAKIIRYAHHNGEPGALFIDAANRSNPVPHLYDLEATNPCFVGETRIPTEFGLLTIAELADLEQGGFIVTDNRAMAGEQVGAAHGVALRMASPAWMTRQQAPVMRLVTRQGYRVTATPDHRFLTPQGYVALRDLTPGAHVLLQSGEGAWSRDDRLPQVERVQEQMKLMAHGGSHATGHTTQRRDVQTQYGNLPTQWSHALGVVLGSLVGDGWLSEESNSPVGFAFSDAETLAQVHGALQTWFGAGHIHMRNKVSQLTYGRLALNFFLSLGVSPARSPEKRVPSSLWRAPRATVVGFLQGLFSADGTVQTSDKKQDCSVRLASSSRRLLEEVQLLLSNFGIVARLQQRRQAGVRLMPDSKGGAGLYPHQTPYELIIGKANRDRFAEKIGFLQCEKQAALATFISSKRRTTNRERYVDTVVSIEEAGVADVYDLTQPDTHSLIANGLVAHNCGEQWLGPYENCCLGSINLAGHVIADAIGAPVVDWALLERTIRESTSFLDNVVSANAYVPAVPEVAEAAHRARRIGLGIMGLGDMMYKLGIRYGSEEGQEFAAQIMEFVRFHSMQRSVELAAGRGAFLAFAGSIYDKNVDGGMMWQPPQPMNPFERDWQRPSLDWSAIVRGIEEHGIRNAAQTTVAPTGTIATVVGCEGYGCEPVFALGYTRHFKDGDKNVELAYTSPLFEQALDASDLSEPAKARIKQHVATYGSCQTLDELPAALRHTFVVSSDISAEEHVLMQAAIQAFTDNSISKTSNFPEGATEEDVAKTYMLAWETGCKGLTVYVTGSREQVVLETKATRQKKEELTAPLAEAGSNGHYINGRAPVVEVAEGVTNFKHAMVKQPRPAKLHGATYRKETPLGTAYITVNSDERNEPFEVFMNVGKAGTEVTAVSEAMGRLISLILRMPGALPPSERLRWVMDEMAGIGGGRPLGFGANRVRSLPDGIAQVLAEHLSELPAAEEALAGEQLALPIAAKPIGDICPECGEASFLNVEGCRKCAVCGYSEC
jgi:ribonucleoside-diphosphate reductase alpha chain